MLNISGSVSLPSAVYGNVNKAGTILKTELVFDYRNSFPTQGSNDYIYIAKDENRCYRYDDTLSEYVCIGVGFTSIQCRLKEV